MKKLLTVFLIITTCQLCATCSEKSSKTLQEQVEIINHILIIYDNLGYEYDISMDYHIGFLSGRLEAYKDALNLLSTDEFRF